MPDYLDVVVVDFDDTLCFFREDFVCQEVVPGALDALTKIKAAGYTIVVSSARNNVAYGGGMGTAHKQMATFLDEQGIPYDKIDLGMTGKPVAYRYVDDKAVGCPLTPSGVVDWPRVCELVLGK